VFPKCFLESLPKNAFIQRKIVKGEVVSLLPLFPKRQTNLSTSSKNFLPITAFDEFFIETKLN
jgi:hypothetical protein